MFRVFGYALATIVFLMATVLVLVWNIAELPVLAVPLALDRTLENVHIVNPGQPTLSHRTVVIEDGVIQSIKPAERKARRNIARYVMPGLIDSHVHAPRFRPDDEIFHTLYLMHGVTTIRNMGGDERVFEVANSIKNGERIGPRTLGCGEPLDGPQGSSIALELDAVEDALEAVADLHESGASCIKVYPMLPPDVFLAIKKEAKKLGLPVVGRMNNRLGIEGAHMDEVHHLHGVLDVVSPGYRTGDATEWLKSWKKKFNKSRIDLAVRMAELHGSAHVPSLVGVGYLASKKMKGIPRPKLRLLPDWYEDTNGSQYYSLKKSVRKAAKSALPRMFSTVKGLNEAGIQLMVGTDTPVDNVVPGISVHDELALLVRAGLTPEQALMAATSTAAKRLGLTKSGEIKEGNDADVLIFSEDPTKDLGNLKTLDEVIVAGRTYTARKLTLHQRKQIKASRTGLYSYMNDLLPYISDFL